MSCENDSIEYLCEIFHASGRYFLKNFTRDEVVAWATFRFEVVVVDDSLNFWSLEPAERGFEMVRDFLSW
jgi:hypothetical protein